MKASIENEKIVIFLEGRIDTTNAAQVESDIFAQIEADKSLTPLFDAENLEYISSAGLRVLLKACKQSGKKLSIRNVPKEIYEILETTGFTEILDAQKKLRQISVEGCELIGSGGYGKVYRIDPETIAKIYMPSMSFEQIQNERDVAQKAFLLGVPTAISYDVVKCGDSYGVVYELLNAKTVAQIMDADSSLVQEMGQKSARLLKELHSITVDSGDFPDRKADFLSWQEQIAPFLEKSEADEIRAFIERVPERKSFLHGDFNSKNVMVNGEDFLLIDIGDASFGHPVFDLAGLFLAYYYLPKSPLPQEEIYRLLGFKITDAPAMLDAMISTYFDIDMADSDTLQKKRDMILPYMNLLAMYHGTRRVNFDPAILKERNIPGIWAMLLPAIKNAPPLEF